MDDLNFRRTIYADPDCRDKAVKKAAQDDPAKQAFWQDIKQLDNKLAQAARVPVPEDLADKLILKQSMQTFTRQKKTHRTVWGLAASALLAIGLTFTLIQPVVSHSMADDVLAHVHGSTSYELSANGDIPLQQVNAQLARFGGNLAGEIGRIFSANYCTINRVKTLHLVVEGERGRFTVFVMPAELSQELDAQFADQEFAGQTVTLQQAKLVIVSDKGEAIEPFREKLRQKMLFSA
ncbi:DUF3379 family protein [Aestuariibacter salexigens]|uniref:DUF3379 family protein n=1 Tax=Aestuariibacter salexigens TaxID=226010 RepID=UPI00040ED7AF|nr:DUF3379 family protein [Aestuariibacter salexigens]